MKVLLNGKTTQFDDVKSLHDIIHLTARNTSHIVAELNGEIIKRERWNNTLINESDRLELVALVAGG